MKRAIKLALRLATSDRGLQASTAALTAAHSFSPHSSPGERTPSIKLEDKPSDSPARSSIASWYANDAARNYILKDEASFAYWGEVDPDQPERIKLKYQVSVKSYLITAILCRSGLSALIATDLPRSAFTELCK